MLVTYFVQRNCHMVFTDKMYGVLITAVCTELQPEAAEMLHLLISLNPDSPNSCKGSLLLYLRSETFSFRTFSTLAPLQILMNVPPAMGRCALRSASTPWAATGASATKATPVGRTAGHAPREIKVYASGD